MDIAYDHIQEETLSPDTPKDPTDPSSAKPLPATNLNTEFQETFKAFSSSPWGARLGGFLGTVRKQGESYYEGARQEYTAASEEALKGLTDLKESIVYRTRGLSLGERTDVKTGEDEESGESSGTEKAGPGPGEVKRERANSDETLRENDSIISRFRSEAAKRLKDIEKAEDAADEALLRFGTNIRNFLRDAVSIAPPSDDPSDGQTGDSVLFESKDADGKRVIHTTRFDAQLHVIHSSLDSFMKDPVSTQWPEFKEKFTADEKTEDIGRDLEKYKELRRAMEKLVPEKVEYGDFWCRYYFLRLVIETEEQKRKELLKGASDPSTAEEIAWDEDSDTEDAPSKPSPIQMKDTTSSNTELPLPQPTPKPTSSDPSLKPAEPRKSNDQHSQPDSEASYDIVSGATSRAPGSPREEKDRERGAPGAGVEKTVQEESDEEDWE